MPHIDLDTSSDLNKKTKILCTFGWRMALAGAETRLIMRCCHDMAKAMHVINPEFTLTRSFFLVRCCDGNSHYAERIAKIKSLGINMNSVTRLNFIANDVISGEITDLDLIYHKIRAVRPAHYNKNLLIPIEAVAAAAFAYCNGGNATVCLAALIGGFMLMFFKFWLLKKGFFETFVFMACAFLGCATTYIMCTYVLDASADETRLAIMATTLLLVPGFPYMNGFLDIFKGYLEIGVMRLIYSIILTACAASGLLGALYLMWI